MTGVNYVTLGSNKLEAAKPFYDELLSLAGMQKVADHPSGGRVYGAANGGMFAIVAPFDQQPATAGNGAMIGFSLDSREGVDAFYAKALALGATCEGPPGERVPGGYLAYFRDLDGNKLCGFKFG
jgi:catechol 2,3-dioxygenase-like lactoylglutathione lyase family enzyme